MTIDPRRIEAVAKALAYEIFLHSDEENGSDDNWHEYTSGAERILKAADNIQPEATDLRRKIIFALDDYKLNFFEIGAVADRIISLIHLNAQQSEWLPIETAPKDGTPIWAYLNQTGIKKLGWFSPEQLAEINGGAASEYDGLWLECDDPDEWWSPQYWLPESALPAVPEASK